MSISIIITNENREVMDTDYFVKQLRKKWIDVKIHFISDPQAPILQFNIADDSHILGSFTGTGVSYSGGNELEHAEFALWYCSIVPADWKLRVYDSAMTFDFIFLTCDMTAEQLIEGFHTPFDIDKYQ